MQEENKNRSIDEEVSEVLLSRAIEEYVEEDCAEIIEKYKDADFVPSKRHEREMKKIFRSAGKKDGALGKRLKKAAILAVALALCGAAALQVDAVRKSVVNFYYEVTGQSMDINMSSGEIQVPEGWDYIYVLGYVPEGYEFYSTEFVGKNDYCIRYYNGDEFIVLRQSRENKLSFDVEEANIQKISVGGNQAFLVCKEKRISLWWNNAGYSFYMMDEINIEETVKIAEKLVKKYK
ncbi:MAG: DUF4367 domain-containing protein [Oscillospiraceae bacterium]